MAQDFVVKPSSQRKQKNSNHILVELMANKYPGKTEQRIFFKTHWLIVFTWQEIKVLMLHFLTNS